MMQQFVFVLFVLILVLHGGIGSAEQQFQPGFVFYPTQKAVGMPYIGDGFVYQGQCVAMSGDGKTAVVGASGDNEFTGAAYIFIREDNGTWVQQSERIFPYDGSAGIRFGWSCGISFDGDTVAFGAPFANNLRGAMWAFVRLPNTTWVQQGDGIVGTESAGHYVGQGTSVALSGDGNTAISGADGDSSGAGAVWVFNRSAETGEWSQIGDKLVPSDAAGGEISFGWSISLSTDASVALIGGYWDSQNKGAAWIFTLTPNGTYVQAQPKLVPTGGDTAGASFGNSVTLSGDGSTAVIGALTFNNYQGATWVYQRLQNGTFVQLGDKLIGSDSSGIILQGSAVSANGDGSVVIVGASASVGAIWVYYRYPNQTYLQQGPQLSLTDGTTGQGNSLSMSSNGMLFIAGQSHDNALIGSLAFWEAIPYSVK